MDWVNRRKGESNDKEDYFIKSSTLPDDGIACNGPDSLHIRRTG